MDDVVIKFCGTKAVTQLMGNILRTLQKKILGICL